MTTLIPSLIIQKLLNVFSYTINSDLKIQKKKLQFNVFLFFRVPCFTGLLVLHPVLIKKEIFSWS